MSPIERSEAAVTGRFVTFEGPDGAGKSAVSTAVAEAFAARGITLTAVREPGGTPLGEAIRTILMDAHMQHSGAADALLFNAARAQLVATVIRPALARGEFVICDRYADSTLAYQGYGSGVPARRVARPGGGVDGRPGAGPDDPLRRSRSRSASNVVATVQATSRRASRTTLATIARSTSASGRATWRWPPRILTGGGSSMPLDRSIGWSTTSAKRLPICSRLRGVNRTALPCAQVDGSVRGADATLGRPRADR